MTREIPPRNRMRDEKSKGGLQRRLARVALCYLRCLTITQAAWPLL